MPNCGQYFLDRCKRGSYFERDGDDAFTLTALTSLLDLPGLGPAFFWRQRAQPGLTRRFFDQKILSDQSFCPKTLRIKPHALPPQRQAV